MGLGLEILAFPCNQFAGQEPGSNEDIQETVCTRFKAEFPIFDKVRNLNSGVFVASTSFAITIIITSIYKLGVFYLNCHVLILLGTFHNNHQLSTSISIIIVFCILEFYCGPFVHYESPVNVLYLQLEL